MKRLIAFFLMFASLSVSADYPPETGAIIGWAYPDAVPLEDYAVINGTIQYWNPALGPQPTEADIGLLRKPYWALRKVQAINEQQALRAESVVGFHMPQPTFGLMEELYDDILVPAARKSITQAATPLWWGLKQLRDDRNDLLAIAAQFTGCDLVPGTTDQFIFTVESCDGTASADAIKAFDVLCTKSDPANEDTDECGSGAATWDGWSFPLPE